MGTMKFQVSGEHTRPMKGDGTRLPLRKTYRNMTKRIIQMIVSAVRSSKLSPVLFIFRRIANRSVDANGCDDVMRVELYWVTDDEARSRRLSLMLPTNSPSFAGFYAFLLRATNGK